MMYVPHWLQFDEAAYDANAASLLPTQSTVSGAAKELMLL